ncbi:MAG: hypothetical protein AB8H86_27905 [Polyangiales bacterium]
MTSFFACPANVAQRYVVGSQSSVEEIEVSAARVSTAGERLVITTSAGYRLYALEDGEPTFIDTAVLPSAECRIIDTVRHPFRDEAVFVGCDADPYQSTTERVTHSPLARRPSAWLSTETSRRSAHD